MRLQELSLFRCLIGILRRARTLAQIRRPKPPLHRYRCPHDRPRINCHGGTESRRLLPGNPLRSRVRNSEVWYNRNNNPRELNELVELMQLDVRDGGGMLPTAPQRASPLLHGEYFRVAQRDSCNAAIIDVNGQPPLSSL